MAVQVGCLLEFLGGNEHAHLLLPILESLLGAEQSKVREKVRSFFFFFFAQFFVLTKFMFSFYSL